MFYCFPCPSPHQPPGFVPLLRNLRSGNPRSYKGAAGKAGQPLPWRETLLLLPWKGNTSALCSRGGAMSTLPDVC